MTTTEAIGYKSQKDALEDIFKEEGLSMLKDSFYYRPDELRKVRRIVESISPGMVIRATVYRLTYHGTVLGYKRKKKGWTMGLLLLCSGQVKEVSIDPKTWDHGENTHCVESGGIVYVIFKHGYRLVMEPQPHISRVISR